MRPAALLAVALLASTAAAQTVLTIDADKPLHPVSPMLYGLMTEEINYSYDGGLYAEMVRNRTFAHDWSGFKYWYLDNRGDAQATMSASTDEGPSDALNGGLQLTITKATPAAPAALLNEGWWGMALKPNTSYNGSFYARGDVGPVTVSLVNNTSGTAVATAVVNGLGDTWAQHTFTLKTGDKVEGGAENHLMLSFAKPGTVSLQLVSLFPPTYKNRANGNRPDLMELMAGMHPKFLRMPGGNYLEGDQIDERFDWKLTLGPLVDRPTHMGPWTYQSSDGLGLLEFLEWTEDLKMEPVLAVYAGFSLKGDHIAPGPALKPFVEDALDEIEFVTGDTTTKWGAVRAKLGHPAPFPLHYVEIGNEDNFDRSGSYEGRYTQFYRAIKAKYPNLQLIATEPLKKFAQPDVIDDHYYKREDEMFVLSHKYDDTPRNGPKIFVGEWATREGAPTTNWGAALGDAAFMTGMERNSDVVVMSAYAPMLVNVNPGGMQWESDLIGYDAARSYGSPSYYTQSVFAANLGTEVPTSSITGADTRFFYSVTRDKNTLYLKLVNASTTPQTLDLHLNGAQMKADATVYTLHGDSRTTTNTINDPERIKPVKSTMRAADATHHTVPGLTVQVLALPLQ